MCIDIVHFLSLHAGIVESQLHAFCLEFTMRCRARHVISIGVCTIADYFSVDMCAACFCMVEAFEDYEASAFAHNETAAVLVERTGCMLRVIVVVHAKSLHGCKTCYSSFGNSSFRTTGYHYISIAALNHTESITNAVGTRSASRNRAAGRTMELVGDSHLTSSHVRNHHRHEERADAGRSFGKELLILAVHGFDTTDTRTDEGTNAVQIFLFKIQAGIFDGEICCSYSKLRVTVHTLGFFLVNVLGRVKVLNFTSNLRREFRSVETADLINTVAAFHQAFPEFILARTNRGNGTYTSDNYAITQNE